MVSISFRETRTCGALEYHDAPARQFVVTLSGTLDFHPGDILFAEDTAEPDTAESSSTRITGPEPT
jgi:hypothetical protein